MKGWDKARLTEGIDFDDRILEEPDNVEEVLLQRAMEELMMESEIESSTEDSEPEIMVQVPEETQKNQQKKIKQKQITDFFNLKNKFFFDIRFFILRISREGSH